MSKFKKLQEMLERKGHSKESAGAIAAAASTVRNSFSISRVGN